MAPLVSVTVKLHGTLNRYLPDGESSLQLDLAAPSTAGSLLEELGVPFDVLDVLFLNGRAPLPGPASPRATCWRRSPSSAEDKRGPSAEDCGLSI